MNTNWHRRINPLPCGIEKADFPGLTCFMGRCYLSSCPIRERPPEPSGYAISAVDFKSFKIARAQNIRFPLPD